MHCAAEDENGGSGGVTVAGVPAAPGVSWTGQAQLEIGDGDRELAVGGPRVGAVLAEQLELGDVPGGEVPGPGVQLEDLRPAAR